MFTKNCYTKERQQNKSLKNLRSKLYTITGVINDRIPTCKINLPKRYNEASLKKSEKIKTKNGKV